MRDSNTELKRCSKCVYPETARPYIYFDEDGVCSGCKVAEEKKKIDWAQRQENLFKFIEPYRRKDGGYECVVGVSGGKDSHYQVHYVKKILGLKPLLVTFNHLDNSKVGIRNLENLVVKLKCDHVRFTPNPDVVKRSCRWAIKKMADPFWHEHAGIYTYPVQVAVQNKIPLIIWGEYGFADLVGMYSHNDFIEMSKKNRQEHGMRGMEAADFVKDNDEGLLESDFLFTKYPSDEEIQALGLKGIYLSNFIEWNPIKQTQQMIFDYGFKTDTKERTFNTFENVETYFNDTVHDYMKYLKYGYGRATDHASQLIRLGYMTRERGLELVKAYDSPEWHAKLMEFLKYIEMPADQFFEIMEKFQTIMPKAPLFKTTQKNGRVIL